MGVHLYRIGKRATPNCLSCDLLDSPAHRLMECPRFDEARILLKQHLDMELPPDPGEVIMVMDSNLEPLRYFVTEVFLQLNRKVVTFHDWMPCASLVKSLLLPRRTNCKKSKVKLGPSQSSYLIFKRPAPFRSKGGVSHDRDDVQDGIGLRIDQPNNLLSASEDQPAENIQPEETRNIEVTRKGTPRIRKKSVLSKQEKQEQKKEKYIRKHSLYQPCQASRLKFTENISEAKRKQINSTYCGKNWLDRRNFILISTTRHGVKRRRGSKNSSRKFSFKYFLTNENEENVQVCKTFFLTTLGYSENNDTVPHNVLCVVEDPTNIAPDGRGKCTPSTKIDREVVKAHIVLQLIHCALPTRTCPIEALPP
ncbi:hypothetical protein JTB14_023418 [Gonioctena quinquepunctata]|nr:hypothetical protein JTB14_023418 [Gonioctena quinquepunctata]